MGTFVDYVMANIPASLQRAFFFVCLGGLIVLGGLTTLGRIAEAQTTANRAMTAQGVNSSRLAIVEQRLAAIEQKQAVVVQKLDDVKEGGDKLDRKIDVLLQRTR